MKKLLLALFIAASLPSLAQSWAAPGATWYYDLTIYAMPFPQYGYERIQNIGDTIIASKQYNKLQIHRAWYNQQTQQTTNYTLPQLEFTRADSGVVYYYRDSAEYVLYNFNAQPGETWVLRNEFEGTPCDTSSIVVDSIATVIINGDTLRVLRTSPVNWNGITFLYDRIIEKIGSTANLFPYTMCVTDVPQGYNLRCYSDSTGWMYQNPNWSYACDDIMKIEEHAQQNAFTVIPDMQSHVLKLSGAAIQPGAVIQVYNSSGQLMLEQIANTTLAMEVNFQSATSGVYFVTVTTEESRASVKFFIE
jgi:hypothetical protein